MSDDTETVAGRIWTADAYHTTADCHSRDNIDNPRRVSRTDAEACGLSECRICAGDDIEKGATGTQLCTRLQHGDIEV